ncbi:hypothetical protein TWF106_000082 [Orbilia oligospora]|uniref:chitinase n=1 Tax=Orbilia oligospora TaxID=2813651 RepID=A0A7C8VC89_ORBOL|nr:hypothetical protein TWF106_000082 [Orbilia oligospora]
MVSHRCHLFFLLLLLNAFIIPSFAQQSGLYCDSDNPCEIGCCSKFGSCGFGPSWCGPQNCVNNCNAKAECGEYAARPGQNCPLNVCCSKWGFCGVTSEFCNSDCQSNCKAPSPPQCGVSDSSWTKRRIGYYETWKAASDCDGFPPEKIPSQAFTHINVAFAEISADFKLTFNDLPLIGRIGRLKARSPALNIFISVGGWGFSDPGPTQTRWSDMASTSASRAVFIRSVMDFLELADFDGVDLDWEYPGADDRGGKSADFENYVSLVREMRIAFSMRNPGWDITMAIPTSYWYLRHFDVKGLQSHLSWFNLMSYDLHGLWDAENPYIGPYVYGHTNLTEIGAALDLLLRNDVKMQNVVMGMGFYGRSYTLSDISCYKPGCVFLDGGVPGECSKTSGVLTYREIQARKHRLNDLREYYDGDETGVKYMVYDGDQWISYDDEDTFEAKRKFMSKNCMGGVMIWAIDQDTEDFSALSALIGEDFLGSGLLDGGPLTNREKKLIRREFSGFTGDDCYITRQCAGIGVPDNAFNTCKAGYVAIERVHSPPFDTSDPLSQENMPCSFGQYKSICCNVESPPQSCIWKGGPGPMTPASCFGGKGDATCGQNQYELTTDSHTDSFGLLPCANGKRSLCCDKSPALNQCHWTDCIPIEQTVDPSVNLCNRGRPPNGFGKVYTTWRGDQDNGARCPDWSARIFCCPAKNTYRNCQWKPTSMNSNSDSINPSSTAVQFGSMAQCYDRLCPDTQLTITRAQLPERMPNYLAACYPYDATIKHKYCCDPPWDENLPVDPKYLWANPSGEENLYSYQENYGNNDHRGWPGDTDPGDDPYGFIMLDGPEDALQSQFPDDFEIIHKDDADPAKLKKRSSLLTEDKETLDNTFTHEESTHLVYCKVGRTDSCKRIFKNAAADTIIKLPNHIGSGPFARVVSMEEVIDEDIPAHHKMKRSNENNNHTIYKLTFDYAFHLIKRDTTVHMRMDYTNLVRYWDEITDEPGPSKKKRWWGPFGEWLQRLNTVEGKDVGKLPMHYEKSMLLYRSQKGCPRGKSLLRASLDITANVKFDMNARWAYYLTGTIVPLRLDETYAYFSVAPDAELSLEILGNAELKYPEKRVKIIDTLSYPGLSVKGIAAVGPTLDLWGSMAGKLTISGKLKAGTKIKLPQYEMYYPMDQTAAPYEKFGMDAQQVQRAEGITPILEASVSAEADLDISLVPEINLGIQFGLKGGTKIVDAQIVGFMNNTVNFNLKAQAQGGIGSGGSASYDFVVSYFYNFGFGGRASFISFFNWVMRARQLFPGRGKQVILYEKHGAISTPQSRRSLPEPIENATFGILDGVGTDFLGKRDLVKRVGWEDVASFAKGLLDCNDGGRCAGGGCTNGACDLQSSPRSKRSLVSKRADEEPEEPLPLEVCDTSVPNIYWNCKYFEDHIVTPRPGLQSDPQWSYFGVCHNMRNGFAVLNAGLTVTLNMEGTKRDGQNRRDQMCGKYGSYHPNQDLSLTAFPGENDRIQGAIDDQSNNLVWAQHCKAESSRLNSFKFGAGEWPLTGNENWLTCDEFPFASTIEGGNPAQGVRACTPGYQQGYQSVLIGNFGLWMNERVSWKNEDGTNEETWVEWIKWDHPLHRDEPVYKWLQSQGKRRTFAVGIFDSAHGPPQGMVIDPSGSDTTDWNNIVAVINLRGNSQYRLGAQGTIKKNAMCVDHDADTIPTPWGDKPNIKSCRVRFVGDVN